MGEFCDCGCENGPETADVLAVTEMAPPRKEVEYAFNAEELTRLHVYRNAVKAGFYNEN